jgi:hypothetical protein
MTRLIDADALNREIDKVECFSRDPYVTYMSECIANAPTVDAVPVRHGKWDIKKDPFGYFGDIPVCSECDCTSMMRIKTKYCPHCGARMDEE